MSDQERQDRDETTRPDEPKDETANPGEGDYEIGYGRPPKKYQWKPGKSGNPQGRPRQRFSKKATWDGILSKSVSVREEGQTRKVTTYEGIGLAQVAKALKGDTRSARFVIEEAERAGYGDPDNELAPVPNKRRTSQGDLLFESIDLALLSEEDKVELARLVSIIEMGGDFTALNTGNFERIKEIVNKGRGKDAILQG